MNKLTACLGIPLFLTSCISKDKAPPNVILLLADDLGYNDISVYRENNIPLFEKISTAQTPNIDKLAEQGLRFTGFYCGAAVCSPSRSALITGRNASRLGIYNWIPANQPMHLRSDEVTLAELLASGGYKTGHFGKWHLTSEGRGQPLPEDQGFDYSFYTYNNAIPSHKDPVNFFRHKSPVGEMKGYSCQLVMNEALGWLDSIRLRRKPFYMNIWFNEPHDKLAAPDSLCAKHSYNSIYYGAIENMDNAVGRLLSYLEEKNLDDNTIIIFSSDNGSQVKGSNDPFRGDKAFNFEGGLRVPFIIKWKNVIPEQQVTDFPGNFTDVLPTISSLTGIQYPGVKILDGINLEDIILNPDKKITRDESIFFYRYFHDPVSMLRNNEWVLLGFQGEMPVLDFYSPGEWALIKPEEGKSPWSKWGFNREHMDFILKQEINRYELYNIEADPVQKNELSGEYPDIMKKMSDEMNRKRDEMLSEGGNWYSKEANR